MFRIAKDSIDLVGNADAYPLPFATFLPGLEEKKTRLQRECVEVFFIASQLGWCQCSRWSGADLVDRWPRHDVKRQPNIYWAINVGSEGRRFSLHPRPTGQRRRSLSSADVKKGERRKPNWSRVCVYTAKKWRKETKESIGFACSAN